MSTFMVNGELPLLQAQGIPTSNSALVIQVRCPAGLSVLTADDAYDLVQNIKRELEKHSYESKDLREWKRVLDEKLASMTDEELEEEFHQIRLDQFDGHENASKNL